MSAILSAFCLAGAIATICALRLAMLGWKVELVTFGSPRVGNASFSSLVKKLVPNNARFVNPGDLVPSWPPLAFKFSHVDKKYALGQKNNSGSQAAAATDAAATDATHDADPKDYKPEKGTCCGCIPQAKPPGKKGHGTAAYVTNLLLPMNVKEFPPGFNMAAVKEQEGAWEDEDENGRKNGRWLRAWDGKNGHDLTITENKIKSITLKAPVNETLDRADVERVAQAV